MHLTPAILESAYEYLRTTPPFSKWGLPEADDVEFRVTGSGLHFGECETDKNGANPVICISRRLCSKNNILIQTLAHELCHVKQFVTGYRGREASAHGPKFDKLAKQACRSHGWDIETF